MKGNTVPERIHFIDFLRGIAIILMVEQHMGIWLWAKPATSRFIDFPILVSINALGGFAAPLFITLAGAGSYFFINRHGEKNFTLFLRGIVLIAFGYLLNFLTPSWFTMYSWYVLHMIGFAILISPLLNRCSDRCLYVLIFIVLAITVILQNHLNTPIRLTNRRMGLPGLPGGPIRYAITEGHFPIFPWLSFFIAGIITGRRLVEKNIKAITAFALVLLASGILLIMLNFFNLNFTRFGSFARIFRLQLGFYPASPVFIMLMIPLVLFAIVIMQRITSRTPISKGNMIVNLGQISLTILMIHVVVFKELSKSYGYWQVFSVTKTVLILSSFLVLCIIAAKFWSKYKFKYGFEWLLRKVDH